MFTVQDPALAVALCILTMIGWGSWANTLKLAGKDRWPFPLYYWDYAWGVLLFAFFLMLTLGSSGSHGMPALRNITQSDPSLLGKAMLSGAVFNVSNVLLVVAIEIAGMAVAFPVGVGLALVIGTVASYIHAPKGGVPSLVAGVALVVCAMILSALAYRRLPRKPGAGGLRGLLFAVVAGALMGFFYPILSETIAPGFASGQIQQGYLTPYTALFFFGAGLVLSNLVINTVFMRSRGLGYGEYFRARPRLHLLGIAGGAIWMAALSANLIASGVAGPAVSYALGQGATLVAAIWGVFIWREFRDAPRTSALIAAMFTGYIAGLALIGAATL